MPTGALPLSVWGAKELLAWLPLHSAPLPGPSLTQLHFWVLARGLSLGRPCQYGMSAEDDRDGFPSWEPWMPLQTVVSTVLACTRVSKGRASVECRPLSRLGPRALHFLVALPSLVEGP